MDEIRFDSVMGSITTAEELLRARDIGRCELLRGEFRALIPPGAEHGRLANEFGRRISNHVADRGLGTVFAAETGFLLAHDPDTVRAPDVGFVKSGRPPVPKRGYYPGAPDLAVEVLSPDDRPGYVRDKVAEWLEAGAAAVWVVDPDLRTVAVYGAGREARVLRGGDGLEGGAVLPGFAPEVREIFA